MDVTDLKSGPLSGQTAGAQGGKTPLVGQLCQRIVLIHELGQLGASEKLLYRRGHGLDIDQGLGGDAVHVLGRHPLPHHSLHTGQTDAVLILEQLAYGADPPVAQMINVVRSADLLFEMHIIVNRSKDIFSGDMLGHQFAHVPADGSFQLCLILSEFRQDVLEHRIVYHLRDPCLFRFKVHITGQIHHHVGENLLVSLHALDPHKGDTCVLDLLRLFLVKDLSRLCQDLTRRHIHGVFCQSVACQAVLEGQFFIKFITAYLGQIISSRVKEHAVKQALGAVYGQGLARTYLLI